MHILLLFTVYASSDTHMYIHVVHVVAYITLVFWTKLKLKISISLTMITMNVVVWKKIVMND
jgi:hypothetical protein